MIDSKPGHQKRSSAEQATEYLKLGLAPFPGKYKDKLPDGQWTKSTVKHENVAEYFPDTHNILVINGTKSGNLVDIDLDCQEARLLAPRYLPDGSLIFGRESSPSSHWIYRTDTLLKRVPFQAPQNESNSKQEHGAMIIEIRGDKSYTVWPGSVHPSGEPVVFCSKNEDRLGLEIPGPILTVSAVELLRAVRTLAGAALIARAAENGSRNALHMHLAGALLRQGMNPDQVKHFGESVAIASKDDEIPSRIDTIVATCNKFEAGEEVTGVPSLIELIGEPVVDQLFNWLKLPGPNNRNGKPHVHIGGDLSDVIKNMASAIHAANNPPSIFKQGSSIVRVTTDPKPEVVPMDIDRLRLVVADAMCTVISVEKDEGSVEKTKRPDRDILGSLLKSDDLKRGLPELKGFSSVPVLTKSGKFQTAKGYDPATCMILTTDAFANTKSQVPSQAEVASAVEHFTREVLSDFPFDAQASKANALAAFITSLIRGYLEDTSPLFLVEATTRGSGKTLLASSIAQLTSDHHALKPWPSFNEEEREKLFTSLLRANFTHIVLDNVSFKVVSSSLDSVLTSRNPSGRILGSSIIQSFVNNAVWLMTSNNADFGGDLASRAVLIRLDPQMERPEERQFKHRNFLGFIRTERVQLIGDLVTIVNHWVHEGMPGYDGDQSHRMDSWASVVGGILDTAKIPGFLENMDQLLQETDSEQEDWAEFVKLWAQAYGGRGILARNLVEIAFGGDDETPGPLYTDEVATLPDKSKTRRLTNLLKKNRGRVIGENKIVRIDSRKHGHLYRLDPAERVQGL